MQGGLTSVLSRELEVGHPLLHVPPHLDVLLGLALLQSLVVVCLQLDQRAEYVLVLVGILVAGGGEGRGREGGREGEYTHVHVHTMYMYILPSKLHVCFFPSSSLPTLHMSSILLICVAVICRALACSLSDSCFTSSDIRGAGFLGGRDWCPYVWGRLGRCG